MRKYLYSVVVSVFNEEVVLNHFYQELVNALNQMDDDFEILFVNDGSRDRSGEILDKIVEKDERVSVIHFSRNFGQEAAMLAGIDHARGDAVICMDSDLQHPLTILSQMISMHRQGKDIVTMTRTFRADGASKYSLWKLPRLSFSAITSFSKMKAKTFISDNKQNPQSHIMFRKQNISPSRFCISNIMVPTKDTLYLH